MHRLVFTLVASLLALSYAAAQELTVSLTGADTVRQGEVLQLTIAYENLEANSFEMPELVGLTVVGGPSRRSQMSIVNGVRSSSTSLVYSVLAEQPGLALVPAVEVEADGETYASDVLTVFITEDADYVPLAERKPERRKPSRARKPRRPTVKM